MTIEQLREVQRAQPFRPYVLEMADGKELSVPHAELLLINPKNPRTAVVAMPDGGFKIVDLLLVATIHVKNGRHSSKGKS